MFLVSGCCGKKDVKIIPGYKIEWKTITKNKKLPNIKRYKVPSKLEFTAEKVKMHFALSYIGTIEKVKDRGKIVILITQTSTDKEAQNNFGNKKILQKYMKLREKGFKTTNIKEIMLNKKYNCLQYHSVRKQYTKVSRVFICKDSFYDISFMFQGDLGNLKDIVDYFFKSFQFK